MTDTRFLLDLDSDDEPTVPFTRKRKMAEDEKTLLSSSKMLREMAKIPPLELEISHVRDLKLKTWTPAPSKLVIKDIEQKTQEPPAIRRTP